MEIKSRWIKQKENNKIFWKRYITSNNNEITIEYSYTEPSQTNIDIENENKKINIKQQGKIIYTKWINIYNNIWKRYLQYPWNEIEEEYMEDTPLEFQNLNINTSIEYKENNYNIIETYPDNSQVVNNIETTNIPNIHNELIDRYDGNNYWIRYINNDNNSIIREVITDNSVNELDTPNNINTDIKDKEKAILENKVKYSSWSKRYDNNGDYWRRYITWPWGEIEREIMRNSNLVI